MKRLFKLVSLLTIGAFFVACAERSAEGFTKSGKAGNLGITYSSSKPLVVGDNSIDIKITNAGKAVTGAKVEMKVFMPEMPGMPYMEAVQTMKADNEGYRGNIHFSMGGTWQVKIFIEKDGKKYKHASSVIL